MDKIRGSCRKNVKINSVTCEHCLKNYHPAFTTLKAVRNTYSNIINAYRSCIAVANSNSHKRDSISETDNNKHPTVTNSSTVPIESDSRTHVPNTYSDPLQQILEKLIKLESLDKRFTEMQASFDSRFTDLKLSFVTRFTEVKTTLNTQLNEVFIRMTNLEGMLAPLEDLPLLSTRLSIAEEAITQVQTEQANLRASMMSSGQPTLLLLLMSLLSDG